MPREDRVRRAHIPFWGLHRMNTMWLPDRRLLIALGTYGMPVGSMILSDAMLLQGHTKSYRNYARRL